MKRTHVNIHHPAMFAANDEDEQFESINNFHKEKWKGATKSVMGFYGGYHYLVERNGFVAQFRGETETGAHNNAKMMNYRAIGVCFAGNMSRQHLTEAQIKSGVDLIKAIQSRHFIPDENVTPHRLYKNTQCPGSLFPDPVWGHLQREYDKLDGNTWKEEARKWAIDNKISTGERPGDPLTRVELWQTLKNYKENSI